MQDCEKCSHYEKEVQRLREIVEAVSKELEKLKSREEMLIDLEKLNELCGD